MTEENKKKENQDIFITQSIYPEAASIFTFSLKSLEEIKNDCIIVLDTNVLLAPYIIGKEDVGTKDLLSQCREIYKALVVANRLIIPGQVAREFAKNRIEKLAELYQQLSRKRNIQPTQKGKYPLLNSLDEYQEMEKLEEEINKKIREYQTAIAKVLAYIQKWQLNDPVRSLYQELFNEGVILDPSFDEEALKKDLNRRKLHHIPPGYKDAGKPDEGIGDLLIWYTILEIGKAKKKSVIFVSSDEKPDWFKQSENVALYLRYELIDEFRRKSEGQSLYVIKFSRFLELYEASQDIIEEIKQEEENLTAHNVVSTRGVWEYEILQECEEFFSLWRNFIENAEKEDIPMLQGKATKVGKEVLRIAHVNATSYSFRDITKQSQYVAMELIKLGGMEVHTDEEASLANFIEKGKSIQNQVRHLAMLMNSLSR